MKRREFITLLGGSGGVAARGAGAAAGDAGGRFPLPQLLERPQSVCAHSRNA
jgi:hypothetical protein